MKRDLTFFFSVALFLGMLPGCGRIIDFGKSSVEQGEEIENDVEVARDYIRSSRTYDIFTLVGAFDSLWLADEVREMYTDLYALKYGKTEQEKKIFLRRQFEENIHFISFYLLSVADIPIGDKDSAWAIYLRLGDNNFVPVEFKKVELNPEFKLIFGKKFTRFKTAYLLRFNAKDIEDVSLINPGVDTVKLVFRTIEKEVIHEWNIDGKAQLKREDVSVV